MLHKAVCYTLTILIYIFVILCAFTVFIQLPMEKLKQIAPQLLEGDTGWQMRDTYTECLAEFNKYEERIIMKWQERITSQLTEKLKQPVMVRE
mgnify:FL=1